MKKIQKNRLCRIGDNEVLHYLTGYRVRYHLAFLVFLPTLLTERGVIYGYTV